MFKCIGTKIKQGEMIDENKNTVVWDYCRCSCITDETPDTYGKSAEIVKIKHADFERITGLKYEDHSKLVDKDIDLGYIVSENKPVLNRFRIVAPQSSGNNK